MPQCHLPYLPVEHGPHDGVKGALGDQVVHVDGGRLPDAVGAILRLLDVTGVPVQFGKHHMAGGGEGQTLERTHISIKNKTRTLQQNISAQENTSFGDCTD